MAFFIGAAAQLRAEADLAVLSSWPAGAYPVEHAVNFTLTVTNQGPDPASGVVLTNLLPATFVLNSVFASQGTWSRNGSVVSCDLGELTNQQAATVSFMVTPMATGLATNQTLLSTSSTDTNLVNNTVSKTVSVRPPYCYVYGTNVVEGDAGFTNADITVQLEFPISLTVSMSFNTGGDSATAGVDYVATNGVLIIPPGVTNQTLSISVIGDRLYEGSAKLAGEWFNGYFGSPTNAVFSQQRGFAVCNIMDDDPKPTLTVNDIAVVEGQSGTTQAVFTVSLSAASGVTTTFQWATANGTATAGQDYGAASSSSATIAAGQTNRTVNISVYGDTAFECDEFFLLNLLSPVNATLARTQAVCTIVSDELSLHLPARINENNGLVSGAGEIIIGCGNASGLVVTLSNPAPGLVSMPALVILPPGESNALFDLQTIDDSLLNGSRLVTITASAPLHASAPANLVVDDNESSSLSLVVPTVVEEGTAGITGQVHVANAPDVNTTVGLSSSDTSSVQTPPSVVIPAGQTSASFTLVAPNDFQLAGTKSVTLTAHVQNWSDGLATMAVTDLTNLSLTLPAELVEGQWATGVVQTTAAAITNLPIALQVSDANALSMPATVEIPAGALSANFVFQAVEDAVCLGNRSVQITASSALLRSATNILTVWENDPDHFTLSKVPVSQEAHVYYYNLILTACDPLGLPLRAYNRSATLSAAGMAGPVDVLPATTDAFVQGVCTQYYYFHSWDNNVHLSVTDGQGHAGQSNPFNIVRPFHHKLDLSVNDLAWDPIRGRIIASVANYWNAISNTLAFINPTNGRVESTLDIGPSPGRMAISDDAHYLYVSFQATNLIRRLDLASRTVDLEFSLGEYVLLPGITYPLYADDMQVQPGNPEVLAVSRMRPTVSPRAAGIAVYNHGVMRASVYGYPPSFGPNYIEFGGAPTRLYGYDTQVSSFTFHRMNVTEVGVVGESTAGLMQGYGLDFACGGGRIYVSNGQIYNPETGGLIGTLPNSVAPVPAPDINKIICIRQNGSYPDLLQIFDASTLWLLHQDYIPGASGTAASALRWGDGGVAFRTTASQVYILQSAYLADLDGDGVPDPWENEKLGSVSAADRLPDADPDHDGLSNRAEYVAGTNPLDASSTLRIAAVRKDGNDLQISIPSVVGRCYQVERCSGLGDKDWTVVDALPGTGDTLQLNDPGAVSAPVTFYRAKVFF